MLSFAHDDEIRKAVQSWSLEKKVIRNPGYRTLPGEEGYDEMKDAGYKRHQKYVHSDTGAGEFSPRITNFLQGEGFRADATNPREGGGMVQNAFSSLGNVAQNAAGAMSRGAGAVSTGMRGAAEKIGQGASAVASATPGMARNAFSSLGSAANAAGRVIGAGANAVGRGANAAGRGAMAVGRGASNAAGTAMYGTDRSGRDASGLIMPGMGNLVGQSAAAIGGALSGRGAMNAIEARNQRVYGGAGAPAMDRAGQKNMRANMANAKTQERWGNLPPQFADAAGYQTPEQRAGTAEGTLAQGTGGVNGNPNIPDSVKETVDTTLNADGTPSEIKTNTVQTINTDAGSGGGNAALPDKTKQRAGKDTVEQTAPASSANGANQQSGANYAQRELVDQASRQANTRGGVGTGLLSNVATFGLSGLARGAYNRGQRRQGQERLRTMAGGNFTASFDSSALDDYWNLQKQRVVFRDKNTTEAIRHAFR